MKKFLLGVVIFLVIPSFASAQALTDQFTQNSVQNSCTNLQYNMGYRSRDAQTNSEVSTVQDFLAANGYLSVEPTGYFGLQTVDAVKKFQSAVGIGSPSTPGYGNVGPLTRSKINAMSCSGGTISSAVQTTTTSSSLPAGCSSTVGYSYLTGARCLVSVAPTITYSNLPAGCSSLTGYSLTTGNKCDGSLPTPQITSIQYYASTIANGNPEKFSILGNNLTPGSKLQYTDTSNSGSTGYLSYTIYASTNRIDFAGNTYTGNVASVYRVKVIDPQGHASNEFTVDTRVAAVYPPGCTSTYGWSSTTGNSCSSVTRPAATASFRQSSYTTNVGSPITIYWDSANADRCQLSALPDGVLADNNWKDSGMYTVNAISPENRDYSLYCQQLVPGSSTVFSAVGAISRTVRVVVNAPAPVITGVSSKGGSDGELFAGTIGYINGTGLRGSLTINVGGRIVYSNSSSDILATFTVPPFPMYPATGVDLFVTNTLTNSTSNTYKVNVESLYPAGCTSNTGWSSTTGQSCASPSAPIINSFSTNNQQQIAISGSGFSTVTLRASCPYNIGMTVNGQYVTDQTRSVCDVERYVYNNSGTNIVDTHINNMDQFQYMIFLGEQGIAYLTNLPGYNTTTVVPVTLKACNTQGVCVEKSTTLWVGAKG